MKLFKHQALTGSLAALFLGVILYPTIAFDLEVLSSVLPINLIESSPTEESITLLFTGDMMFDRAVRKTINTKGFDAVFGDAKKIFTDAGADLVIANLEGPITSYPSRILRPDGSTSKELNFTFATGTARALKDNGVDIVNLANNHTANQGSEGLAQTKKYLSEADVTYFGHPGNKTGERSTTVCKNNFCIALIGWHEFAATPASDISNDIRELRLTKTADIIVILPHWGAEYKKQPSETHRAVARSWIDAGADFIIGTHPHVIQSIEEYKGKVIFYSLGNFIFDQYFSFDTTHGLVVSVTTTKEVESNSDRAQQNTSMFEPQTPIKFDYKLIPIENIGTVVSIPNATTSLNILENLGEISAKYIKSFTPENISNGSFSVGSTTLMSSL